MKIKITADSTCDLNGSLAEKYDIEIIPLSVIMDDTPYRDYIDIKPQQIFDYVARTNKLCHTAAVNTIAYTEVFGKYSEAYDAVIHINLSSGMSACYQNAKIAAEAFDNVYVFDSQNLSSGSGHLAIDAAIMAKNGSSPDEIMDFLNDAVGRVETSFVLDTLNYIYKGGRCSGVAALGANLLHLKPCIEVIDGKMQVGTKYRGNLNKVLEMYVADRLSGRDDIDYRRIFITHTGLNPEAIEQPLKDAIMKYGKFDEIITNTAGCTIANHCGPNCFGILFYRKKQ